MERTAADVIDKAAGVKGEKHSADSGPDGLLQYPWPVHDAKKSEIREEFATLKKAIADKRAPRAKRGPWDWAEAVLPCVGWLRTYNIRQYLLFDILAGVAVGFTVVPQGMSYANITGLPAVFGLYGAFLPVLVYSLFGSCRQLGTGPVAVTSGLIFSGLSGLIPGHEQITDYNNVEPELKSVQAQYNKVVIQLAFLVACLYTAVGVLRLGFLIRFLSHPVITGFTSGAALVIAAGQVKYLLGVSYKKQDTLQGELSNIIAQLQKGNFKWQEFIMGMSLLGFLISLKFIQRKWPKTMFLKALGPFLVCVIGIVVVAAGKWTDGKGPIKIVKTIPHGLPPFTANMWVPVNYIDRLLPLSFIVMAVDMLESTSIARALARKNDYALKYNQEIVALGLANFAGAMFSSYTTTGSFSRSAINNSCGARTNLAGFVTSMIVMCVLLFLTPIFKLMPYNAMGAIIIVGVSQLVEIGVAMELWKVHVRDFVVWLVAFIVTTFAGVEIGLVASILLSLLILILETAFPHASVLGRLGKTNVYRNVEKYPEASTTPGIVVLRLDAPLFFANTAHFETKINQNIEEGDKEARAAGVDGVKFLVLDMTPVVRSDSSGAHFIHDLARDLKKKGIQLILCNPTDAIVRMLERIHLYDVMPRKYVFVHTYDGVRAAQAALDDGENGLRADVADSPSALHAANKDTSIDSFSHTK